MANSSTMGARFIGIRIPTGPEKIVVSGYPTTPEEWTIHVSACRYARAASSGWSGVWGHGRTALLPCCVLRHPYSHLHLESRS